MIHFAGYRNGPFEVKSCLNVHPAVAESAVVPKPEVRHGTVVKAYEVRSEAALAVEETLAAVLQDRMKSLLSAHEYPREVEFVEKLPKTVTGKSRRVELRERERSGD